MSFRMALVGAVLVAVPVVGYVYSRHAQHNDVRSVAPLRLILDSFRVELRSVATATDSQRFATTIQIRERGLSERNYHLVRRQAQLDAWWHVPSVWSVTVAAGVVLLVLAGGWRVRSRAV